MWDIVLDTNVIISATRSRVGASFKILEMIDRKIFQTHISVPLLFEYEAILKRDKSHSGLSTKDIDDLLDYFCLVSKQSEIFYLWRPKLSDPKDDFILELAVESNCDYIVTHNIKDFKGTESFGIGTLTPEQFLKKIGEHHDNH